MCKVSDGYSSNIYYLVHCIAIKQPGRNKKLKNEFEFEFPKLFESALSFMPANRNVIGSRDFTNRWVLL